MNLYLVLVDLPALAIIGIYLFSNRSRWWQNPGTNLAMGLFTYICGHAFTRAWTWLWRTQIIIGHDVSWMDRWPSLLVGNVITTVGLICVMKTVSSTLSTVGWIIIVMASAAVSGLVTWLV